MKIILKIRESGLHFPRNTHPIENSVNHLRQQRQVTDAELFRLGNGGVEILNRQIVEDLLHPPDRALHSILNKKQPNNVGRRYKTTISFNLICNPRTFSLPE